MDKLLSLLLHLKKVMSKLFLLLGYEVRSEKHNGMHRLAKLMTHFNIDLILDVGANYGQFSTQQLKLGYIGSIISFEPLKGPFKQLCNEASQHEDWYCFNCALSNNSESKILHVADNEGASSSFLEFADHHNLNASVDFVGDEEVQSMRLDDFSHACLDYHSNTIMLKLDVQGHEMEVLDGASNLLSFVDLVFIEVFLLPLYQQSYILVDYVDRMNKLGFVPIATFFNMRSAEGFDLAQDILFVRKEKVDLSDWKNSKG
jgi:FkbM family methyltransferase